MQKKLTIEEFREYKEKLLNILKEIEECDTIEQYYDEYFDIQCELLDNDLSDIPFKEWKGIKIFSDIVSEADFSNSKANIDFNIVSFERLYHNKEKERLNLYFENCNLKNIDKLYEIEPIFFDNETIKKNQNIFLSDSFVKGNNQDFINDYYSRELWISDLAELEDDKLKEILSKKSIIDHLDYSTYKDELPFFKILGLKKVIKYYKENKDELHAVEKVSRYLDINKLEKAIGDKLKKCKTSEIKDIVFDYAREALKLERNSTLSIMPDLFKKESPSLYLKDEKLPEYIRQRYYNRCLKYEDIIKYSDIFLKDNIENFINYITPEAGIFHNIRIMAREANNNLTNILKKYLFFFESLYKDKTMLDYKRIIGNIYCDLSNNNFKNIDVDFIIKNSVKEYYEKVFLNNNKHDIPDWLLKFDFKIIKTIKTDKELQKIDDNTIIIDNNQREVIKRLGLDNVKRLNNETKIFTHKFGQNDLFTYLNKYFKYLDNIGLDFSLDKPYKRFYNYGNEILDYDDFVEAIASHIALMRIKGRFKELEDKDYYINKLEKKYKDCFINKKAPKELKLAYYTGRLSNNLIFENIEWIKYLNDVKIIKKLCTKKRVDIRYKENEYHLRRFIEVLIEKFGNEYTFELMKKYGSYFDWIDDIECNIEDFDDKESLNKLIRKTLYEKICNSTIFYGGLSNNEEMVKEYPEIFINSESRHKTDFYYKQLSYGMLRSDPSLKKDLKGKRLDVAFARNYGYDREISIDNNSYIVYKETELIKLLGNNKFLNFIETWGQLANESVKLLLKEYINLEEYPTRKGFDKYLKSFSKNELISKLEELIIKECRYGRIIYDDNKAPSILKERCPELFLDNNTDCELKDVFYNRWHWGNIDMSFKTISERPSWAKQLQNKSVATAILRRKYDKFDQNLYNYYVDYFDTFGFKNGVKLGIKKPDDTMSLIEDNKTKIMKQWYDKTGKKFIPDGVIVSNIPIKDADKFLSNTSRWINIQELDKEDCYKDTLIKMAYIFGAFKKDSNGYNKLMDELSDIPKVIKGNNVEKLEKLSNRIDFLGEYNKTVIKDSLLNEGFPLNKDESLLYQIYKKSYKLLLNKNEYPKSIEALKDLFNHYITNTKWINLSEKNKDLLLSIPKKISGDNCQVMKAIEDDQYFGINCAEKDKLIETLINEGFPIDKDKTIFEQLYEKSYTSAINRQSYPKTVSIIRRTMKKDMPKVILTLPRAENLFEFFTMKYDPYFTKFLFDNFEEIKENDSWNNYDEYAEKLGNIQSQFQEIKVSNSNRKLTLALAESYVEKNKYNNVNTGNEELSRLASIIDYNQEDFEVLQDIYNYGKLRTFSSIPKIEGTMNKRKTTYKYEIIGLNDPMALAIGELSDCCQRLNDAAELDAEHSMIDPNGRIFIVRDDMNNIVAQSWVWRNKDVLCFDNIEIPHKASDRFEELYPEYDSEEALAMDIFKVYQKAAKEILEEDNKNYKKLLDNGKITKEQYEGLRLGVVTVGLGYNEIASTIRNNAITQEDTIKPLKSDLPIELNHNIWLDSKEQFSLAKRHDRTSYEGDTLPIYPEEFKVLNDKTMNEVSLLTLKKLELETKGYDSDEITSVNKKTKIVTELANNYEINPSKTKVIMNPNFGIIYEENDDKIVIADLVYNLDVNLNGYETNIEDKVLMQICLALKQIKNNKKFNTDMLNDYQKDMFNKALKMDKKIDIERGLSYVKQ